MELNIVHNGKATGGRGRGKAVVEVLLLMHKLIKTFMKTHIIIRFIIRHVCRHVLNDVFSTADAKTRGLLGLSFLESAEFMPHRLGRILPKLCCD
jgi:hypothetical protein